MAHPPRPWHPVGNPRRTRLFVVLVTASALVAAGGLALKTITAAGANGLPAGVCTRSGKVMFAPALTVTPKPFTFTETGSLGPCRISDSSIQSGTVTASGSGYASCAGGSASAVFTIRWNDGTESSGTATPVVVGPLVTVTYNVTTGEFAGGQAGSVVVGMLADPSACTSSGVPEVTYAGIIGFGGLDLAAAGVSQP